MRPPVSGGVACGVPEGRYGRNHADDTSRRGQRGRPSAGAPWTPPGRAAPASTRHTAVLIAVLRHHVRRAEIGLHEQLIDAETAAEDVFGQYHRAEDRVEHACGQRRPGRFLASATSATPVTTKASAVLNDIGFWLPKRKMTVARTNQATITSGPRRRTAGPPP